MCDHHITSGPSCHRICPILPSHRLTLASHLPHRIMSHRTLLSASCHCSSASSYHRILPYVTIVSASSDHRVLCHIATVSASCQHCICLVLPSHSASSYLAFCLYHAVLCAMSCYARCHAMHAVSCYAACHIMLCSLPCHALPCHAIVYSLLCYDIVII